MDEQPLESHNAECRRWWAAARVWRKWILTKLDLTTSRIERRQLQRHLGYETGEMKAWAAARLSTAARSDKSRAKQFAPAHGWAALAECFARRADEARRAADMADKGGDQHCRDFWRGQTAALDDVVSDIASTMEAPPNDGSSPTGSA